MFIELTFKVNKIKFNYINTKLQSPLKKEKEKRKTTITK